MIINKFDFPIYACLILASIIIGIMFNFIFLYKAKVKKEDIIVFITTFISCSLFFAFWYTIIFSKALGLSSYGGAIGILIAAIFYSKIQNWNTIYLKSSVLSLPLFYSISKLACFFAGCCYGIPYKGPFSITYPHVLNSSIFPIQLLESICFMIIFIFCITGRKNKYIVEITIITSAIAKFLLDFLRYSHIGIILSTNQIVSILFVIGTIILIFIRHKKKQSLIGI